MSDLTKHAESLGEEVKFELQGEFNWDDFGHPRQHSKRGSEHEARTQGNWQKFFEGLESDQTPGRDWLEKQADSFKDSVVNNFELVDEEYRETGLLRYSPDGSHFKWLHENTVADDDFSDTATVAAGFAYGMATTCALNEIMDEHLSADTRISHVMHGVANPSKAPADRMRLYTKELHRDTQLEQALSMIEEREGPDLCDELEEYVEGRPWTEPSTGRKIIPQTYEDRRSVETEYGEERLELDHKNRAQKIAHDLGGLLGRNPLSWGIACYANWAEENPMRTSLFANNPDKAERYREAHFYPPPGEQVGEESPAEAQYFSRSKV